MRTEGIEVRPCTGLEEFEVCVEMQRRVWGEDITVPSPIFVVAAETGGQVLGAFEGGRMVGFTLAMAAFHGKRIFLHSHMTAVLPDAQNRGIGRQLKLAQRDEALSRGIELVEWTFDPLELKNAHFNLVRLGAIARRFIRNCYGVTGSPLHAGLPTDRLVAQWWLRSKRVEAILAGKPTAPCRTAARISVPANIGDVKHKDPAAAAQAQKEIREEFEHWLRQGYMATGMEYDGPRGNYILEPADSLSGQLPVEALTG